MRAAALAMSRAPASTSYVPATNAVGTATLLSETRRCWEVRSARCMYQSTGVVRNSEIAFAATAGSAPAA